MSLLELYDLLQGPSQACAARPVWVDYIPGPMYKANLM